jgi:hypothetical protein
MEDSVISNTVQLRTCIFVIVQTNLATPQTKIPAIAGINKTGGDQRSRLEMSIKHV